MTWQNRKYEARCMASELGALKVRCSMCAKGRRIALCIAQPETYMQEYPERGTAA